MYDGVNILLVDSLVDLIFPCASIIRYIFAALTSIFRSFIVQLVVDSAHIDRVSQLCLLKLAFVSLSIRLHLLHEVRVDQFLHVFLTIDLVKGNLSVLFWSEMSLSRLLNVFSIDLLS